MNSFSYVTFIEVLPGQKELKVIHDQWLTDMPPLDMREHITSDKMAMALLGHCHIFNSGPELPVPGFYRLTARGLLEFGADNDGGTVNARIEYAGFQPAPAHQMRDWFIEPQPRRPVFLKVLIDGKPVN